MTTIVFHNNTLATDSRGSHTLPPNVAKACCQHCGEKASLVNDDVEKIVILDAHTTFKGECILAVAGAGSRVDIERQIAAMQDVNDYYDAVTEFYAFARGNHTYPNCALILVTEQSVFEIDLDKPKKAAGGKLEVNYTQHVRENATVCIGSGKQAAMTAIKVFGKNALEAISVAAAVDKYTGGSNIAYAVFDDNGLCVERMPLTPVALKLPEVPKKRSKAK